MQVANKAIEDMLKSVDPQTRKILSNIVAGKIIAKIYCLSQDRSETREVPVLDKNGEPELYKSGKQKGEVKTKKENVLVQKGCDGREIGHIYDNGRVEPVQDEDGKMYLRSTRKRLDGAIGAECWCGNDSRISLQEAGDIDYTGRAPTKEGLEKIFHRIKKNPTVLEIKNGRTEIDGFAFEELR